jgi:hypothetical protein
MSSLTKIIYAALFVVLLLQPHLIQRHIFPSASPYVENAVTISVFVLGFLTYLLHQHDVKKKELENQRIGTKLKIEQEKLLDSFKYLGLINRRLPLLQNLTSDLLSDFKGVQREKKRVFERLLNTAIVSIANAEWGMLRFVHESKLRTLKEFSFSQTNIAPMIQLGNKELLQSQNPKNGHALIREYSLIIDSNTSRSERCFLILPRQNNLQEEDSVILRAIVDQALLFYAYIYPMERATGNGAKLTVEQYEA